MSGRSVRAALETARAPLQQAVSCVCRQILVVQPGAAPGWWVLRFPEHAVQLRGRDRLTLRILLETRPVRSEAATQVVAPVDGYRVEFGRADGRTMLAYHWHPVGVSPVTWPHLHVSGSLAGIDLGKAHLPTGVVPLQDVLRFAIVDLGVEPLRDDWRAVLAAT